MIVILLCKGHFHKSTDFMRKTEKGQRYSEKERKIKIKIEYMNNTFLSFVDVLKNK
jgi:hypothetical protein